MRGLRRAPTPVEERLERLAEAVALAEGRLPADEVAAARDLHDRATERLARGTEVVVAALAGGTGSGKSALFNALAGAPLSQEGVVRPMTTAVTGWAVGDPENAGRVLDWLGVTTRHSSDPDPMNPEGLILLDLPDHDSVAREHREVVDRFVDRVDVLIWVVDPLKYAQRALHDGYLRRFTEHASVTVVVLNRIDQLDDRGRAATVRDLRRLLAEDGFGTARVLATSARTGEGVPQLRALLNQEVRSRRAVAERINADLRTTAVALGEQTGRRDHGRLDRDELARAIAGAAGVGALGREAGRAYRQQARDATRPLVSRGLWAVVALPARALRRMVRPPGLGVTSPTAAAAGAEPSPVAVRHALLRVAEDAGDGLPRPWTERLRSVAEKAAGELPRAVRTALDRVDLAPERRLWWLPYALLWSLVEAVALAGIVWLVAIGVVAWLQLPPLPTPDAIGAVPWPTALLGAGVAGWLLLWLVRGLFVALGAGRHRRAVVRRLHRALGEVGERAALDPLREELAAHDRLAELVGEVGGR